MCKTLKTVAAGKLRNNATAEIAQNFAVFSFPLQWTAVGVGCLASWRLTTPRLAASAVSYEQHGFCATILWVYVGLRCACVQLCVWLFVITQIAGWYRLRTVIDRRVIVTWQTDVEQALRNCCMYCMMTRSRTCNVRCRWVAPMPFIGW